MWLSHDSCSGKKNVVRFLFYCVCVRITRSLSPPSGSGIHGLQDSARLSSSTVHALHPGVADWILTIFTYPAPRRLSSKPLSQTVYFFR